jgi:NAD(P)-dependent dehydrogenase (short-subunit alcohol dehydrogenase family)
MLADALTHRWIIDADAASKHGQIGLTRSAAAELAPQGSAPTSSALGRSKPTC